MKTIKDIDVKNIRVLVRVDFDVPMANGKVSDNSKIKAALPTINYLREHGARIILMSHLGQPKGHTNPELRLNPVANELEKLLNVHVKKVDEIIGKKVQKAIADLNAGEILLLENLRFNPGEATCDDKFAMELASLADIYVNDAFGIAHKEDASNVCITKYKLSYAGLLMEKELENLSEFMQNITHPFVLVLGGMNPEIKIPVIERFITTADYILVGGMVALSFLKAQGYNIGLSNVSDTAVSMAKDLILESKQEKHLIKIPDDFLVADEIKPNAESYFVSSIDIPDNRHVVDIGPRTFYEFNKLIYDASQVLWNGPMGVFEIPEFSYGTRSMAQSIASTDAKTIIGGSDTLEAINRYNKTPYIDIISTGGCSFLNYLEGRELPAVRALQNGTKR